MNSIKPKHSSEATASRLIRIFEIIGPTGLLPISRSSFYGKIKAGEIPQPIKLGARISAWREADILAYINQVGGGKS
ncbi:helix-turn-helix transcriptional regulator [Pseudovibrio sp. SCP19]|uniref:helix-turn-helix transcriptional regulator n=1 Tax=Pseudovibrio sp. SCP19 TaxID=3141374 RepID=UPI00333CFC79